MKCPKCGEVIDVAVPSTITVKRATSGATWFALFAIIAFIVIMVMTSGA